MTDTTLREKIACALWNEQPRSVPAAENRRTPEEFAEIGETARNRWLGYADAALAVIDAHKARQSGVVSSQNIYGDPSLGHKPWHVRHNDEIWTDDDEFVASCNNAPDAHRICALHNAQHLASDADESRKGFEAGWSERLKQERNNAAVAESRSIGCTHCHGRSANGRCLNCGAVLK